MSNVCYVKKPTFVINANGKLSESLRADNTKGQKMVAVQTHNFESLKVALSWINKEGQKKSTTLYLYEIRPSTQGAYNVRCAIVPVKKAQATRPNNNTTTTVNRIANATKTTNANANTNANRSNANRSNANANRTTANTNANRSNANATTSRTANRSNANANRTNTNANRVKGNTTTKSVANQNTPSANTIIPNANANANKRVVKATRRLSKTNKAKA